MRTRALPLALAVGLLLVAPGAHAELDRSKKPADAYPSDVASDWFDALYDVIRSEATAPPAASRIHGVAAIALYEAIAPGARHARSLVGQLNDLSSVPEPKRTKEHHWPTVANAALARTIGLRLPLRYGVASSARVQEMVPSAAVVHVHKHSLMSGSGSPSSRSVRNFAVPVAAPTGMVLPLAMGAGTLHAAQALLSHLRPGGAFGW
jgi:hypothetical protein